MTNHPPADLSDKQSCTVAIDNIIILKACVEHATHIIMYTLGSFIRRTTPVAKILVVISDNHVQNLKIAPCLLGH